MSKSDKNEIFARLSLIIMGLTLVCAIDFGLRFLGFWDKFKFVISEPSSNDKGKLSLNSQYVALHYFDHLPVRMDKLFKASPWFEDTEFFKEKRKDVYRIFFIGASTTRGFPFLGRRISYPSIFDHILKDVLPDREIEVINAGYDALGSFGVLDVFNQIIEHDPDLVIAYTGHNEFIGHYGVSSKVTIGFNRWLIRRRLDLNRSSLFLISKLVILKARSLFNLKNYSEVNLFKALLRKNRIIWTEKEHEIAEDHYRKNLIEMVETATLQDVKIILTELPSNLGNFYPLASVFSEKTSPREGKEIIGWLEKGKGALISEDIQSAKAWFSKALAVDPLYAETHYLLGKVYELQGKYKFARKFYGFAREYDKIHLRSCSKLNSIVADVGRRLNIPVLDMEGVLERASVNGFTGENYFFEHVHPNINGHLIMADAYARFLYEHKILNGDWEWVRLRTAVEYVRAVGFDEKQYNNARYTVGRLLMDFPFYQCNSGLSYLKKVGKLNVEQILIKNCKKNKSERKPFFLKVD